MVVYAAILTSFTACNSQVKVQGYGRALQFMSVIPARGRRITSSGQPELQRQTEKEKRRQKEIPPFLLAVTKEYLSS